MDWSATNLPKVISARVDFAALSPTLDTIGPLARSVEDCVLLERVMRGRKPTLLEPASLEDLTLIVPDNVVFEGAEAAISANFDESLERLARAGTRIRRESVPLLDDALSMTADHGLLAGAEAWHVLRDVLEGPDYKKMDIRIWHDLDVGKDGDRGRCSQPSGWV